MRDDENKNEEHPQNPEAEVDKPITDLGEKDDDGEINVTPELHIADSLQAALKHLREQTDELEKMPIEDRVVAAEKVAEEAAALDEQIGSIARKDDS